MRLARLTAALVPVLALTAGCASAAEDAPSDGGVSASVTSSAQSSTSSPAPSDTPSPSSSGAASVTPSPAAPTSQPPAALPLTGKTVVLDPGHNGANAAHPEVINEPVPNGNGGTKPCNTTGTATNAGYPEHEMTWSIAVQVRDLLTAQGANVVLTRPDDTGIGPCVNERAAIGNDAQADAVVSIHGDGASASSRGFYCILTPLDPGGPEVAAQSADLAAKVRDGLLATAAMPAANYAGEAGVDPSRTDLAGLNLSTRPTTMCELGNMRSVQDAAVQTSDEGRTALATGMAAGIAAFLAMP